MEIKADPRDFEILIINAFRYSMPRFMTAAFDATEKIILDNLEYIQTWVLQQFVDDIKWEYNRYEIIKDEPCILQADNPYVRDDFLKAIQAEIDRRKLEEMRNESLQRKY